LPHHFNRLRVDLAALGHNFRQIKRLVGPEVKIMAVIKADAYGHGLIPAAEVLVREGADGLGVMDLDEAVRLREAAITRPIYLLAGFEPGHCPEIIDLDLIPFVFDLGLAGELNDQARTRNRKVKVQLKLDTGMNRLGVRHDRAEDFLHRIKQFEHLAVTGLATHFSDADLKDSEFLQIQLGRFERLIEAVQGLGYDEPLLNNAANSAAVMSLPRAHYAMVRPGLMLYGAYPAEHFREKVELKPVMSLVSRVVQVKTIPAGSGVSYGRTWIAPQETVLAVVPVGYTHGYSRLLSNRGFGLIRGRPAPVRGRVCMNMTLFDVTGIPGASPGDEVVLLGAQGGGIMSAQDLAEAIGTISYEVLCMLGGLNHREYLNNGG